MILHGIEYQRPTSLNMHILADHVTYSFLAFMKSIFHFCLGCYCGGYSQNGRSNLSSLHYFIDDSYQGSILDWSFNSTEYSEDEIIETMNKSWFNTKRVALQNTQEGIDRVCSEQLVDAGKHLLPEFSEYKFGGQLRHTNVVAWRSFRAIPGNRVNGVVKACMGKINQYMVVTKHNKNWIRCIWVRSQNCSCPVTPGFAINW